MRERNDYELFWVQQIRTKIECPYTRADRRLVTPKPSPHPRFDSSCGGDLTSCASFIVRPQSSPRPLDRSSDIIFAVLRCVAAFFRFSLSWWNKRRGATCSVSCGFRAARLGKGAWFRDKLVDLFLLSFSLRRGAGEGLTHACFFSFGPGSHTSWGASSSARERPSTVVVIVLAAVPNGHGVCFYLG